MAVWCDRGEREEDLPPRLRANAWRSCRAASIPAALVLECEALAVNADDHRMVEDPVEHGRGGPSLAKTSVPSLEGEVRN